MLACGPSNVDHQPSPLKFQAIIWCRSLVQENLGCHHWRQ